MSKIEVWGAGKPLRGFSEDAVLTNARNLFPKAKSAQIARFIAGKRFVITRVNDEAGAQRLIDGLAKCGIEADTAVTSPSLALADSSPLPPPAAPSAGPVAISTESDLEEDPFDDGELNEPEPEEPGLPGRTAGGSVRQVLTKNRYAFFGVAAVLVIAAVAVVAMLHHRAQEREFAAQQKVEAKALTDQATKRKSEAEARARAEEAAADKAKAAAQEALRLEEKEAAVADVSHAFAAGNYPETIALSEKFDAVYGADARVEKLEHDATFNLKEAARRGNFAAILNAPVNNSARFAQLRQWALQVQEQAKPVVVER